MYVRECNWEIIYNLFHSYSYMNSFYKRAREARGEKSLRIECAFKTLIIIRHNILRRDYYLERERRVNKEILSSSGIAISKKLWFEYIQFPLKIAQSRFLKIALKVV